MPGKILPAQTPRGVNAPQSGMGVVVITVLLFVVGSSLLFWSYFSGENRHFSSPQSLSDSGDLIASGPQTQSGGSPEGQAHSAALKSGNPEDALPDWPQSIPGVTWNDEWAQGSRELWTMDAPQSDIAGMALSQDGNFLATYTKPTKNSSGELTSYIIGYSIENDGPKEKWVTPIQADSISTIAQWSNTWIIVNQTLINRESGKAQDAPWKDANFVSYNDTHLIACSDRKETCDGYAGGELEPIWTIEQGKTGNSARTDLVDAAIFPSGIYAPTKDREHILNLATGELTDLDIPAAGFSINAVRDGWVSVEGSNIRLSAPNGTLLRTLKAPENWGKNTEVPWREGGASLENIRTWIVAGETSWATGIVSVPQGNGCSSISLNGGQPIDLAGASSWSLQDNSGTCSLRNNGAIPWILSSPGLTQAFGNSALTFVNMKSGERAEGPPLETVTVRATGDRIITRTPVGKLVGFGPGRGPETGGGNDEESGMSSE